MVHIHVNGTGTSTVKGYIDMGANTGKWYRYTYCNWYGCKYSEMVLLYIVGTVACTGTVKWYR